jgi:predicted nuclease of predicted toxin-antitoxin system
MRLLLDENFNNNVLRGLLQQRPELDVLRAQDVPEIAGKDDPTLLEWAAEQERVLLTHDVRTITRFAYERIREGKRMPGVIEVKLLGIQIGIVVEDILIVVEANVPDELENRIIYLPFK